MIRPGATEDECTGLLTCIPCRTPGGMVPAMQRRFVLTSIVHGMPPDMAAGMQSASERTGTGVG
jgi:hypothetical protein